MFVLGLQGSPRIKGNTHYLLNAFMEEAERLGAETRLIHVTKANIEPCKELVVCEKKGYCPIDDEMATEIYPLLRKADVVVAATPIFFYNCTAQLKALIDRCQTFWARKYRLKLKDPGSGTRRGFLLAVGATRGKNLFEGLNLTTAYFFDAIDASFEGSLTYHGIEHRKDMAEHPTVVEDVKRAAKQLIEPLISRKSILFLCKDNSFLSQVAAAYAKKDYGDRFEVWGAGMTPAREIHPMLETVMAEDGIDMAFRKPLAFDDIAKRFKPDRLVTLGEAELITAGIQATPIHWKLPVYSDKPIDFVRKLRDEIKDKVAQFINNMDHS